jgi:predicted TIM-barrel fold metal-dependent hydrolase
LSKVSVKRFAAVQEPNVYAGLAVVTAFIHRRPHYFGEIIAELLSWLGPDRILYSSDYGIWSPKWIVEEFMDFELPAEITADTGQTLTLEVRRKIMGENAARLYNIDIAERCKKLGLPVPGKPEAAAAAV